MGTNFSSYEIPPPYELPPPYQRPPPPETEKPRAAQLVVPAAHELEDALSCPICLGLLLDPLIAACCQNNFCRQCLQSSLRSKPECPLCRAPLVLENTLPNRALRNLLPHDVSQEVETAKAAAAFRPTRLSRKVPTSCLLLLLIFSTVGLIIVLPLGSGCLSASAALRGGGLALNSLAGCHRAQPEAETEPDIITVVSDASTRGLAQGSLKHSTLKGELVRSPRTYFPLPLEGAGVLSRGGTHLPGVPADGDGAPWGRVAAVDARAAPHLRFASTFALLPPAPVEGAGMAWRRTKGRSKPYGSQPHGLGQAEGLKPVQSSGFQSTDDDAPWRREALAEAMERDDGLATLLSIVPG